VLAAFVLLSVGLALLIGACTEKLAGEFSANQPPTVSFTNIPPDGEQFSRNPVVFWYGSDSDGLIEYYRYHVWAVPDGNTMSPETYVATVPDSMWTIIDVDPTAADQKTTNSIPLMADSSDPVTSYVRQYIFLQAFDYEGMGSEIVYRLYSRNTNPPNTDIFAIPEGVTPFVNSVEGGGVNTGIWLKWQGTDQIDYPSDPPPFEFEWRLYGPFGGEGEPTVEQFYEDFRINVFVTREGKRYRNGEYILKCDTSIGEVIEVECDSFLVDETSDAAMAAIDSAFGSDFGDFEPYLRVSDADFQNSEFNVVAARSSRGDTTLAEDEWVMTTADTIYNVYRNYATQETVERGFVFWIRSRDDAFVADLVPAFTDFRVIEPKHERDVLVINWTGSREISTPPQDSGAGRTFWNNMMETWGEKRMAAIGRPDSSFQYDDSTLIDPDVPGLRPDYIRSNQLLGGGVPLRSVLQHKVMILYNEGIYGAALFFDDKHDAVFKAIDAGVNAWLTMRGTVTGGFLVQTVTEPAPFAYVWYFGVTQVTYSGWFCHAFAGTCNDTIRIEDFIGTYSLEEDVWPPLEIDDSLLEARYAWGDDPSDFNPMYDSTLEALPEVGWAKRAFGTKPIYLYKSLYGADHPLGDANVFEGTPVMHTYDRGTFRTVNMNFTLPAIAQEQADSVMVLIMDFLFEPWDQAEGIATSGVPHYNEDAAARLTLDEARRHYIQRVTW
jgi:hypothetical protein